MREFMYYKLYFNLNNNNANDILLPLIIIYTLNLKIIIVL